MKIAVLKFLRALVVLAFVALIGSCVYDAGAYILAPTPKPVSFEFALPKEATFLSSAKVETGTFKISTDLNEWNYRLAEGTSPAPPIVTWNAANGDNGRPAVAFDYWLSRKDGVWYHAESKMPLATPRISSIFGFWGNGEVASLEARGNGIFVARIEKASGWTVVIVTFLGSLFLGMIGLMICPDITGVLEDAKDYRK